MKNIIIWIITVCLLSCNRGGKEDQKINVAVLRGPSAIAFAQWVEKPPIINGRKIVIRVVDSPEQVIALMAREEADIAVIPMISAANLYNKGLPYTLSGCPVWGNLYWVGKTDAKQIHIFGVGTTPEILTRYHIDRHQYTYELNNTLGTASEIVRGLLSGKVEAAVLGEPFVSMVLQKDSSFHILADLNNPSQHSPGFAETAVMIHKKWYGQKAEIDRLLEISCRMANEQPEEVINIMIREKIFPDNILTQEAIRRCRIMYLPAGESRDEINSFLEIIRQYAPKAIGGKLPDEPFYN